MYAYTLLNTGALVFITSLRLCRVCGTLSYHLFFAASFILKTEKKDTKEKEERLIDEGK